jgi:hypothetical protein
MLYRIMISATAEITLYSTISADSPEEARVLSQALPLDELEVDVDTIHEPRAVYVCPAQPSGAQPNVNMAPGPSPHEAL